MKRAALLAAASALVCFGLLAHAADDAPETGVFTLFKFEQAIGEERYEIRPAPDGPGRRCRLTLTSKFSFEDRGSTVPLETTLQFDRELSPVHFTIRGETARISTIDTEVTLAGGVATIREGAASRREPQPPGVFTMAGYAPPSMQMALMRFWNARGRPASIPLLPRGTARIEPRGRDEVMVDGHTVALDRYSVSGVIWGRETLWTDAAGRLAALVSVDAEFDHFEAVRPELRSAVPQLVARAASDGMAGMAATAAAETPAPSRQRRDCRRDHSRHDGPEADSERHRGRDAMAASPPPVRRAASPIPPQATVVRAAGKTVMPGLWDMHAHFEQVEWGPIYLAAGVTTVRDVGNELEFIAAVRDAVASGAGPGPANAARRHHRRPGAARPRRHPRGDAGRRPRVGQPLSRRRLRSDQDLQLGRARRPARHHAPKPTSSA